MFNNQMDKEKMTDKLISPLICDYCQGKCDEFMFYMFSATGCYNLFLEREKIYLDRRKKCLDAEAEECASVSDADEVEVNDLGVTMQAEEELDCE